MKSRFFVQASFDWKKFFVVELTDGPINSIDPNTLRPFCECNSQKEAEAIAEALHFTEVAGENADSHPKASDERLDAVRRRAVGSFVNGFGARKF